jgi:hypothetical protein
MFPLPVVSRGPTECPVTRVITGATKYYDREFRLEVYLRKQISATPNLRHNSWIPFGQKLRKACGNQNVELHTTH